MVDVLLVEDTDMQRALLYGFLIPEHTVVGVATTGDEAIREADRTAPDVVVMDIDLPGTDGIEATRAIKRASPDVAVVMSTAMVSDESRERAAGAGADAYLMKPFSKKDLLDTITEACSR
ncbi:response regulator [Halopenitus sp. POP-27]|uniref:response regulator n=1 Tax=Halopenitus sp. POP-27 TaxID=2994425 RepID=UPI002469BB46|nr:response regulator [Halopenitus sp. POP-27]